MGTSSPPGLGERRECEFDVGDGLCFQAFWSRSGRTVVLRLWGGTGPFRFGQVALRADQVPDFTERLVESRPVRKPARDAPGRVTEFADEDERPGALRTEWHRQGERITFTLLSEPYLPGGDAPELELTADQLERLVAFLEA
jgi:hypothetical protein